jgi:hypothetical protein
MGDPINEYRILLGIPEGMRPTRRRLCGNIKIDLRVTVWEDVE